MLQKRLAKFASPESVRAGRRFQPRESDVFVVTYPKCGTTWLQQICHVLRTGGSDEFQNFEEIMEVVPWFHVFLSFLLFTFCSFSRTITAKDCGIDLNDEQVAEPRVFKSHETIENVPRGIDGAKYIYCIRDPDSVLVSFFHFLRDYCKIPREHNLHIDEFARNLLLGTGSASGKLWDHFAGWYEHIDSPNVLFICYEHLREEPELVIEKICRFMGVPFSQDLLAVTLEKTSFEYMKARHSQFDDHLVFNSQRERMGLPPDCEISVGKVRSKSKEKDVNEIVGENIRQEMADRWRRDIYETIGFASYEALKQDVWERLLRR